MSDPRLPADRDFTRGQYFDPVSPVSAGLTCRCPRCGRGRLFKGFLNLAPRCDDCGLDYGFADAGDGPAVFVILIAGALVVGLALWVEVKYMPPLWLHAILWLPAILAATLGLLRPLKGILVALQYRNKAAEGRLESRDT
ncbi:DUF983 domain-containing protein [Xanthobacteraceae bacterium A53D]